MLSILMVSMKQELIVIKFFFVNIRTSMEVMYLSRMPSKLEETGHVAFLTAHLNLVTDVTETTWYEWLVTQSVS